MSVNERLGIEERIRLAADKNTPANVLEELSKDVDENVRAKVAKNENTSVTVLKELAKDEHWTVRCAVTYNKNTPLPVLKTLNEDEEKVVRDLAYDSLGREIFDRAELTEDSRRSSFVKGKGGKGKN